MQCSRCGATNPPSVAWCATCGWSTRAAAPSGWTPPPIAPAPPNRARLVVIGLGIGAVLLLLLRIVLVSAAADDERTVPTITAPALVGGRVIDVVPPPRWRYVFGSEGDETWTRPVLVRGMLVLYSSTGRAIGVDAATGASKWEQRFWPTPDVGHVADPKPIGATGVLAVFDRAIVALDPASGTTLWSTRLAQPAEVAASGRDVAVDAGTELYVMDASNGGRRWTKPKDPADQAPRPVAVGTGLMVSTALEWVRMFDPLTGIELSSLPFPAGPLPTAVQVIGDLVIYERDADDIVAMVVNRGGVWSGVHHELRHGRGPLVRPIAQAGLVGSTGTELVMFDAATGRERWRSVGLHGTAKDDTLRAAGDRILDATEEELRIVDTRTGFALAQWRLRPLAAGPEAFADLVIALVHVEPDPGAAVPNGALALEAYPLP